MQTNFGELMLRVVYSVFVDWTLAEFSLGINVLKFYSRKEPFIYIDII
jgi:hypothetical protein